MFIHNVAGGAVLRIAWSREYVDDVLIRANKMTMGISTANKAAADIVAEGMGGMGNQCYLLSRCALILIVKRYRHRIPSNHIGAGQIPLLVAFLCVIYAHS